MKETTTQSQNSKILNWLRSGATLTQFDAAAYFGIYRLGARIYDLKKAGNIIKSELQFDGSRHWSKYSMRKSHSKYRKLT